jgi:hypothetical protein
MEKQVQPQRQTGTIISSKILNWRIKQVKSMTQNLPIQGCNKITLNAIKNKIINRL